jgi:transposase-like protein
LILAGSYFLTKGAGMKKYRHFPLEFKQRIVQEVESGLRSKAAVAREAKIACSLIDHWHKQMREGTLVDRPSPCDRQLMKENDWLKKKVAEQAMEIDILKKIDEYSRRMRKSNGFIVTGLNTVLKKDVRS